MTTIRNRTHAHGRPGIAPRWTRGGKQAVGTAHDRASRVWYTCAAGVLTEAYYPTLDRPQRPVCVDRGLFVCGDHRDTASIQGALISGHRAAEAVLADLGRG